MITVIYAVTAALRCNGVAGRRAIKDCDRVTCTRSDDAERRLTALRAGLGVQLPEAIAIVEAGFAAATQYFVFPRARWLRIRSTNGLERLHGEIKRRIRAVGAFPDRKSALRLVTVVALRATGIWVDRRYLDMSPLDES